MFVVALFISTLHISAQKLENSLLWEISGNGLEQPSYLFGTIHITCDATLSQKVKDALDKTSQIVLEIDIDDPSMQLKMMRGMMMKDGKSLTDLVSEEEYAAIDSLFIKNMGMSVNMLKTMKPSLLGSMLAPKMLDCSIQSFEMELVKIAEAQEEEIKGLETIEYQLSVFDKIPYEEQAQELVRSAKDNLAFDKSVMKTMLEIYESENISKMYDMMNDDPTNVMTKHQDKLLDIRNENWIPVIGKYAKEEPTFFGVGAGHLAGKKGVINLLRKAGYTVKAVMN